MPLPISTTLILCALALSHYADQPVRIVVYVLAGLALLNETLRFMATRGTPPGPPQRQRTPIVYQQDDDAS